MNIAIRVLTVFVTLAVVLAAASTASAQTQGSGTLQPFTPLFTPPRRVRAPTNPFTSRPAVSPFVNLSRFAGGDGGGLNYYGIVRPEQTFRRQAQQQRTDLQRLQNRPDATSREAAATGHQTFFLNLSTYYNLAPLGR